MVAKVLEVLGPQVMIGYDIGCEFGITVSRSSLGAAVREAGIRFCINAFHGYSHAYNCQVAYHPSAIHGMGLEVLEVPERIFSSSNQLAPIIRYTSPYRRWSLIDLHFQQWDHKKYSNLSLMLLNNLEQALEIIRTQTPVLEQALQSLNLTPQDINRFHAEERKFFSELRDEQDSNLHAVAYVEVCKSSDQPSE